MRERVRASTERVQERAAPLLHSRLHGLVERHAPRRRVLALQRAHRLRLLFVGVELAALPGHERPELLGRREQVVLTHEASEVPLALQHTAESLRASRAKGGGGGWARQARIGLGDKGVPADIDGSDGVDLAAARAVCVARGRADRGGHVCAEKGGAGLGDRLHIGRGVAAVGEALAADARGADRAELRAALRVVARVQRDAVHVDVVHQVNHHAWRRRGRCGGAS
eukprot:6173493-Pleurochrysis_carterae.AAC.1